MDNNQNITPDQKDFDELTIETQSFLITFITNLSTVAMRAIAKNKLDEDSNLQNATWFKIRTEYKIDITDSDLKYIYDLTKSQYEK